MTRLIESSSAQLRIDAARAFVETHAKHGDVWLVGASRGSVDDLARVIAAGTGATIGLHRFSLAQLALHGSQLDEVHARGHRMTALVAAVPDRRVAARGKRPLEVPRRERRQADR